MGKSTQIEYCSVSPPILEKQRPFYTAVDDLPFSFLSETESSEVLPTFQNNMSNVTKIEFVHKCVSMLFIHLFYICVIKNNIKNLPIHICHNNRCTRNSFLNSFVIVHVLMHRNKQGLVCVGDRFVWNTIIIIFLKSTFWIVIIFCS